MNFISKNDDDWFEEIETAERKKRRLNSAAPSALGRTFEHVRVAFQDIRDGFSMPKDVTFKYAR
ncbi:MAG: hypothetical protein K2X81_26455 [Candidatus Obscuribacterales bacterium]|nr:hypothetical protein [Candidatus Obscuribacterales bacterium]